MKRLSLPSRKETVWCAALLTLWLVVTYLFVGLRPEHPVFALIIFSLFFVSLNTRRLLVALVPFILFGASYDLMNIVPNYRVNPVDIEGLYLAEKAAFGIATAQGLVTPNEFFAIHHSEITDFMAGIFYLCWVPLPLIFGLWLFFTRRTDAYLHFAIVFLLVNLIGFAIYYLHPAAPPWYVALHGFDVIEGTSGDVAGLGRFDAMTGCAIFNTIYSRNSNVFAALPSLHSAYTFIAFIYSLKSRSPLFWKILLGIVTLGIWFTAVYSSHHYVIDVLAGIGAAIAGIILFECILMKIKPFAFFMKRYKAYVSPITE